jgi:dipeptidyl-peptidase-3
LGKSIEEAHMRNRALIANWVLEHGKKDNVVELARKEGKIHVVIHDYNKMRTLIGELLAEIQRVKSEGDFEGAKNLVEKYGVKVDTDIHKEILERYAKLHIAPYKGFVNPYYEVVKDASGNITNIIPTYKEGYAEQMLRYAKEHSHLPTYND